MVCSKIETTQFEREQDALISVIIPVYNVCNYLNDALDSVLRQTYKNIEIIIIDDGSTDGSAEICEKYAKTDNRIVLIHQKNKGLSAARNVGIDMTHGELLAFIDSDDIVHPDYLKKMYIAMGEEDADIIICKVSKYKRMQVVLGYNIGKQYPSIEQGCYERTAALRALSDGRINYAVWNKLYKRRLWNSIRFPEGRVFEDIDTIYKIFDLCQRVTVIDDSLYYNRLRLGSITNSVSQKSINDWFLARKHFDAFVVENIPVIFNEKNYCRRQQLKMKGIIKFYLRYDPRCEEGGAEFCNYLRNRIIRYKNETDGNVLSPLGMIAYYFIRFFPQFIKSGYLLIQSVRFGLRF